jgi:hypothetical protein
VDVLVEIAAILVLAVCVLLIGVAGDVNVPVYTATPLTTRRLDRLPAKKLIIVAPPEKEAPIRIPA